MDKHLRTAVIAAGVILAAASGSFADALTAGWQNPPESAKPRTWWHWMHGNITKQGITRDLEAMKRVGIGGATIFHASLAPKGKIDYFSPEWFDMMLFASQEAKRLGLELSMHNSEGWSSSGGPWVKPVDAMKMLVYSDVRVTPQSTNVKLAQPYTRINTYGDIAVLAFPTPAAESNSISSAGLTDGSGQPIANAGVLWDGDVKSVVRIPQNSNGDSIINIRYAKPTTVRQITFQQGVHLCNTVSLQAEGSDGKWQSLGSWQGNMVDDRPEWQGSWPVNPTTAQNFRVVFSRPAGGTLSLGELRLDGGARVPNINVKSLSAHGSVAVLRDKSSIPADAAIAPGSVINISKYMQPDGTLSWHPTSGEWTVIRFGWTPVTVTNHPATEAGIGLEVDKLDLKAVTDFYNEAVGPVVKKLGSLAGSTLKHILIDSYETGPQNWTPGFDDIFRNKNHYDLMTWLPVITGRYVGDTAQSERFLWDFRNTISDRWVDVYYKAFAKLCHDDNMLLETEPYGDGPLNSVYISSLADIPMTEYWAGTAGYAETTYQVASGAHIGGKNIIGAEAFTGNADSWQYGLFDIKQLGDSQWCAGVNRYIFHTTAHQADERLPGYALGPHGMHFDRHNTWFEQSKEWMKYVSRSQYLLQKGLFVADVLQLAEEGPLEGTEDLGLPLGWRSDRISSQFLAKCSVKNGQIVAPSGISYRFLVLPGSDRLSASTMNTIYNMVMAGATVVGNPPNETPGLAAYPKCDADLQRINQKLWGDTSKLGYNGQRTVGKGRVIWGKGMPQVLADLKIAPDIKVLNDFKQLNFIHRRTADADIYFVCNTIQHPVNIQAAFRVTGKLPEIWHPDTGKIEVAAQFTRNATNTVVPLMLDGTGSVFVVFRTKSTAPALVKQVKQSVVKAEQKKSLTILAATYGVLGDPAQSMDATAIVNKMIKNNSLELEVTNKAFGRDPAGMVVKQFYIKYKLGDETVEKTLAENSLLLVQVTGPARPDGWVSSVSGKTSFVATKPGNYVVSLGNGKTKSVKVDSLPTMTISAPWQVSFTPGWDAPAKVEFNKLINWIKSDNIGIKYYSGTAKYTTTIQAPRSLLGTNRRIYLDLGQVNIMAEVQLNGKPMGILWKPPYRVDVTDVLKAGANSLEVKVTNNWVNQLIRDAQRPADQKKTWLPWPVFNANSTLQDSGLIGPVQLITEANIPIK